MTQRTGANNANVMLIALDSANPKRTLTSTADMAETTINGTQTALAAAQMN